MIHKKNTHGAPLVVAFLPRASEMPRRAAKPRRSIAMVHCCPSCALHPGDQQRTQHGNLTHEISNRHHSCSLTTNMYNMTCAHPRSPMHKMTCPCNTKTFNLEFTYAPQLPVPSEGIVGWTFHTYGTREHVLTCVMSWNRCILHSASNTCWFCLNT